MGKKAKKKKIPSLGEIFSIFGRGQRKTDKLDLTGMKKKDLKALSAFMAANDNKHVRKNYYSLLKQIRSEQREKKVANNRAVRAERTQSLSSLPNEKAFSEALTSIVSRRCMTGKNFATFMIDIDEFKNFNDTYGYAEGNKVILAVANKLKEITRAESDLVTHWGGDEFAIIAGDVTLEEAERINEKLKAAFPMTIEIGNDEVEIKCSVGFVSSANLDNQWDSLPDTKKRLTVEEMQETSGTLNNRDSRDGDIEKAAATVFKLSGARMAFIKNPEGLTAEERGVRGGPTGGAAPVATP